MEKTLCILSLFLFTNLLASAQDKAVPAFYCPPCDCQAHEDDEKFNASGTCPHCGMDLLPVQNKNHAAVS
ncbi:heavy metal-binding domain-containing protein [Fodinibius salsisoli]|uniref:heavy metal-binding domain-containing protein n=1 Tax=Fodinibius salsisoli TaxID=2820877 RepID=UPI00224682AE|nr:heavy metal-binding domain-containing protein [Fodinibius salsisoli]